MTDLPAITNNPDIRFLGKLLGNVIRAYGGDELFRRTEYGDRALASAIFPRIRDGWELAKDGERGRP